MLTLADLTDHELEIYSERIAIRIYDAHQTEAEAQKGALEDVELRRERMTPKQGRLI